SRRTRDLADAGSNRPGDHMRRRGNAAVAGFTREHAQTVRSARRTGVDVPTGACAHFASRLVRATDRHHQCRVPLCRSRAVARAWRRGRHRARADAPRFWSCGRGLRPARGRTRSQRPRARAGGRPRCPQARRIRRSLRAGRRGRRRGAHRHLRHRAHPSGDELRLHPPRGEAQWRLRARGRGVRGEAGCRDRRHLRGGAVFVEQRQFPVSRRDHAQRDRALRAGDGRGRQGGGGGPYARPRFSAAGKRTLRARPHGMRLAPRSRAAPVARAVLPADLGWSDIGSWSTVWDVLDHDAAGNATDGPVVMLDCRNSLVRSEEPVLTTVVGLDDVIVVSTADAVLVSARSKAEQVKTLVEQLKAHNHRAAVEHRRVYRPWGYYQDVDIAPRYRVKRIVVKPGSKLSLQKHFHRSEHWVVVKGTAEVTLGNDVRSVHENESIYIPIGSIHRLPNPGKIPLELIEVQVGSYLGEDDIVRLDDVYGRG